MRLAMGGAWTSIVAVGLIAATSGLGYLINNAGVNLQTTLVLSGIISISILASCSTACSACCTAASTPRTDER
jgi:ABC-type nitrate/sulfonate/bicarbonate transport system permease component